MYSEPGNPTGVCHSFSLAVIFTLKFCVEKGGERTQQGKCLQAPGCGK